MTDDVLIPRDCLRELTKWAFAASHFDGMVSERHLESISPAVSECLVDVRAKTLEMESLEFPWEHFPNGFADV